MLSQTIRDAMDWRYAILAASSVALCYWLTRLLGVGAGYWAAITSVVVCQSKLATTLTISRDRLIGTLVGAITGWITVIVWHEHLAIFAIALVLTLMICNLIRSTNAGRLAGVTVCIVVLVPHPAVDALHTAISRFLEVAFGICVTLVMTLLFYPAPLLRALKLRAGTE